MTDYPTLDHLPDISADDMATATPLDFEAFTAPSNYDSPWDLQASYSSFEGGSSRMLFSWTGVRGATYDIFSDSFFEPYLIQVYDNLGNVVAVSSDDGFDDYGSDTVSNYIAPYSGTFYVRPGWHSGLADTHRYVWLSIFEDSDTAAPENADDYADNLIDYISPMGELAVGSQVTGNIELAGDIDWFRISLQAGTLYQFALNGAAGGGGTLGGSNAYGLALELYNSNGSNLNSARWGGAGNNPIMSFEPTESGDYYLSASHAFSYEGLSGITGTYTLTANINDTISPTLLTLSPVDNATDIATSTNLILTFSEDIQAGTGNIRIHNANGTIAETIAVTDNSQVSISGNTVTINPSTDLETGSNYYVNIEIGVFKDLAGNNFAGITGTRTYNFMTVEAPVVLAPVTLIEGTPLNDRLIATSQNESINGAEGIDIVVYSRFRDSYTLTNSDQIVTIADNANSSDIDTLIGIERLSFTDTNLALDIEGHAGTIAKTLGAVFGANALSNRVYAGILA